MEAYFERSSNGVLSKFKKTKFKGKKMKYFVPHPRHRLG
jgi:hypothetical protein